MPYSSGVFSLVSGNPVVTGTTISSTVQNNTMNDVATGLSTCVLKDGTQTITANIPMFSNKFTGLSAGTTAGDSVRYEQLPTTGSSASTFTFDGSGGTSGSMTLTWQKSGQFVVLNIPAVTAMTGTNSQNLTSNTAIAASARPTTSQTGRCSVVNNGANLGPSGQVLIASTGIITINRDGTGTLFSNSASGGTSTNFSFEYFVG